MIECKNMFYVPYFNSIGGVETYIFELARKYYKDYDITVIYKRGDAKQLRRLRKYVRVIKYNGEKIKCCKAFFNYSADIIDNVEAEDYIQVVHALYKTQGIKPYHNDKFTGYLCVSNVAGEEYKELTGIDCQLMRNPLTFMPDEKKSPLMLISATRLTPENGKDRMVKLCEALDKNGIKYLWLVFTNDEEAINNPNVVFLSPRLDVRPFIASIKGKGYGVQLSDSEGDCYFTRECEALGIPLLVTPIPSFKEQGLVDGKNCYYLPFDMQNIDVDKIVTQIPKYKGYIGDDNWGDILLKSESEYTKLIQTEQNVVATMRYHDVELDRIVEKDELLRVNAIRAEELVKAGVARYETDKVL